LPPFSCSTPTPLSRGEFGAVASRRILALLKSNGIHSTWFTPGYTIETCPRECEAVVAAVVVLPDLGSNIACFGRRSSGSIF
jgi:peptidoglycan/xylan/chitin deacetylase (PgdA/CDA1 family)